MSGRDTAARVIASHGTSLEAAPDQRLKLADFCESVLSLLLLW